MSKLKKRPTEQCRDVCVDRDYSCTGFLGPDVQVEAKIGKVKPPIYDGYSSWSVYKVQFEAAARRQNRLQLANDGARTRIW